MDELWDNDDGWVSDDGFEKDLNNTDNDENDPATHYVEPGAHHVLILLDCELLKNVSMMDSTFRAFETTVRSKIRSVAIYKSGKRDGFGILLYNTKYREPNTILLQQFQQSSTFIDDHQNRKNNDERQDEDDDEYSVWNPNSLPSTVHELLPLTPPGIQTVKAIQATLPFRHRRVIDLVQEYCPQSQDTITDDMQGNSLENSSTAPTVLSLQLALHQAIQTFRTAKCVKKYTKQSSTTSVMDSKQVWIITANDNPCGNSDPSVYSMVQTTAMDVKENGIDLLVWPVVEVDSDIQNSSSSVTSFNYDLFYDKINAVAPIREFMFEDEEKPSQPSELTGSLVHDAMIEYMQLEWKKTRRALSIPFLLPNWTYPSCIAENNNTNEEKNGTDSNTDFADRKKSGTTENVPIPDSVISTPVPDSITSRSPAESGNKNCSSTIDSRRSHWPYKSGIMVDIYRLIQVARKPPKVQIHQETGRVLSRVRQLLPAGGGDVIAEYKTFDQSKIKNNCEDRLRRYVLFGGERVPMTKQDHITIRKSANANKEFASIILLGFKNLNSIPFFHRLESSYFVYPTAEDETTARTIPFGGCEAFAYLHSSMIRKGVVAIGELLTRSTATSRLVVMWPLKGFCGLIDQAHSDDSITLGDDKLPPGLAMASLPFEDEIRIDEPDIASQTWQLTRTDIASEDIINATIELIQKQTISDVEVGDSFENANLLKFWDYVEQVALDEPLAFEQRYDTVIDKAEVRKIAGSQLEKLKSLLPIDAKTGKSTGISRKRKIEPDDSGIEWKSLFEEGKLSDCKVADLKAKLRSLGEVVSGKKDELISRLMKLLETEFSDDSSTVKKEA